MFTGFQVTLPHHRSRRGVIFASMKHGEAAEKDRIRLWIFDADDTLWESALFFRRAEEDFIALMESLGFNPDETRLEVRKRDIERLSVTGYGARPYMDTLRNILWERVTETTSYMQDSLEYISNCLLHHPLVLLPGVLNTLLSMHAAGKNMVVYTMGEEDHQNDKFLRSGIASFFTGIRIVPVKTGRTLVELLSESGIPPEQACMVGNSPRSDINPALECGVNAVYYHRNDTWHAEKTGFLRPDLVTTIHEIGEVLAIAGL